MLKYENDEENRYYFLPSRYGFHDSEIIDEYIYNVDNDNILNRLITLFMEEESIGVLRRN